jgi:hypothetical protein
VRRRATKLATLGAALVATLATSWPAAAYVRGRTEFGDAFEWDTSCIPATIYTNGFENTPGGLSVDKITKSIAAAAHAWSPDEVTCEDGGHPNLEIVPTLSLAKTPPSIGWDAKNVIVIRTENWTKSGRPSAMDYPFGALAVTTVTARGKGHVVDADIEINAVGKAWLDLDPGVVIEPGQTTFDIYDLQNTLTHEFGHFLGLDHTCYNPNSEKPRPTDEVTMQMVPDCDGAPPEVANTVMFDRAESFETSKRTLKEDDIRAVCDIYDKPTVCEIDQANDACAIAAAPLGRRGETRGMVVGALAVGALAFAAARRRSRRSRIGG